MADHKLHKLRRGDLWSVDFGVDPTDPEQAFVRPAVIVSDDRLHRPALRMVIVVPGTSTMRDLPLHVVVAPDAANRLAQLTALEVERVRSISTQRLLEPVGSVTAETMAAVDETLLAVLGL